MPDPDVRVIDRAALGTLGPLLGQGRTSRVHQLAAAPGGLAGPQVYREFRPGNGSPPDLGRIVALRAGLTLDHRTALDGVAVWPARVVEQDGTVVGLIERRYPASFLQRVDTSGRTGRTIPRRLAYLTDSSPLAGGATIAPTLPERIAICRDLAAAVAQVHAAEIGAVLPGLTARSVLVRLAGRPAVTLVDCEIAAVPDPLAADAARGDDVGRLAALVEATVRQVAGSDVSDESDDALDRTLGAAAGLVVAARDADVRGRPGARDLADALAELHAAAFEPPRDVEVRLRSTIAAVGRPVGVEWRGRGVSELTVEGPFCPARTMPVTGPDGVVEVHPHGSGPLIVTARNDHGQVRIEVGPVFVFGETRRITLPVPVPDLGAVALPDLPTADVAGLLGASVTAGLVGGPPMLDPGALWTTVRPPTGAPPSISTPPPPGIGSPDLTCPVDLTGLLSGSPVLPAPDPGDLRDRFGPGPVLWSDLDHVFDEERT